VQTYCYFMLCLHVRAAYIYAADTMAHSPLPDNTVRVFPLAARLDPARLLKFASDVTPEIFSPGATSGFHPPG
jgi:hypothetical protein